MESKIEKLKGKYYIYPKNSKDEVVEYLNALCEKQNEIIDHLNSQAQPEEEYRYLNGDKPIKDRRIIEFMEGLPERVWEDTTEEWSWKFLKGGCEPTDYSKQPKMEEELHDKLLEIWCGLLPTPSKASFDPEPIRIRIEGTEKYVKQLLDEREKEVRKSVLKKVPEIRVPELDKWVEEELSKLNK